MNAKDQNKDAILKRERDVIEEQKTANKQLKQTIQDKEEVNNKKDAEINKVNQENEELKRQLAEAQKMLAQTTGHQVMKHQIDVQKRTTRDALSYVAELKRERSIFHSPSKSEEEKMQDRKERLMDLLQKSESKKWDY